MKNKSTLKMVRKWLNRRSQKGKMSWTQFASYLKHYPLPKPKIVHSFYDSPVRRGELKSRMWEIHKSGSVRGVEVPHFSNGFN